MNIRTISSVLNQTERLVRALDLFFCVRSPLIILHLQSMYKKYKCFKLFLLKEICTSKAKRILKKRRMLPKIAFILTGGMSLNPVG